MGISWSNNRRRNNNYLHHPPPSHQFIPSSYLYTSDQQPPPSSNHPPLPPPPPPPPPPSSSNNPPPPQQQPQQQNYMYPSNPPYHHPLPPPPHNLYPTHPPPPPPPNYSSYYYSHGYNSCNYANPMMGQSNYPPYYANQINGWSAIRPAMPPSIQQPPPITPAPYVEHQNAKKVRNDVNVHKDTLRVEVDEQNPDQHLVSFEFDALFDGSITLYYFAKEEFECKFVPLFPEAYMPLRIPFQKGLGQKFRQPSGTGIDLGFFELDDLSKPSPGEDVFPLVIASEACSLPDPTLTDDQSGDPVPETSANMQITQAVLEKKNDDPFRVRVIRQILWVDGVRYELREIYGIGSSTSQDFNDSDSGKECIICMTEPKDTAVLPCRHMCMCSECAKELRLQSDKCPICRQPIEELIEIKINSCDQ